MKQMIGWLVVLVCAISPATAERPNIILVLVDDMGWSNIGCYGGMVETPNIDRLARNGVRFNQFYNGARCCPTRATLMTGLHPHQVGVGHMVLPVRNVEQVATGKMRGVFALSQEDRAGIPSSYQGWLDAAVPTLPEMLRRAGYGTYLAGKWHLASDRPETWPIQRGFDRFYGHLAGTSDYFEPTNLYRGNVPISAGGEHYYLTDAISEEAINFLSDHLKERAEAPFFLYLSYNAPHFPMQCMPEDFERYRGRFMDGWDVLREKRLQKQKEMGLVPSDTRLAPRPQKVPAWHTLSPQKQNEMDAIMATYAAMIDRVDRNIGKLLHFLEQSRHLDNTLIFFLSDNGGEAESGPFGQFEFEDLGQYGKGGWKYGRGWATLSNTPFREYKHFTHQGGVQTPMIVHWPDGVTPNSPDRIISHFGYLPDIVATCMELARAARPTHIQGKSIPEMDGISLVDALRGSPDPIHTDPIFVEHEGNRIARHGKWKLVSYYNKPWELYDLDMDRSESDDLVEKHPEVALRLQKAYRQWADRCGVISWDIAKEFRAHVMARKKAEAAEK